MPVSVRTRFEILKRDNFTCRYCGRSSPSVVLEVDHIVPLCEDGSDDPINLITACWECNRGKSGKPLSETLTGEDPHDRAVTILERERQIRELNDVLRANRENREAQVWELLKFWTNNYNLERCDRREFSYLLKIVEKYPPELVREYMESAIRAGATQDLRYVKACLRSHGEPHA